MNVLVIDDEHSARVILGRIIELRNHNVFLADTAKNGLLCLKNEKIDIVFVDVVLPDILGTELCKTIRKLNKKIKIVLITGLTEIDISDLKDCNISKVLYKPANIKDIRDVLDEK